MKNTYLIVFILFFFIITAQQNVHARHDHSFLSYLFTPSEDDHDHHYLQGWPYTYDSDWEYPGWHPSEWAQDLETAQGLIDRFYTAGFLEEQVIHDGRPVLLVGQPFLALSGRDQRRMIKFVGYVFDIETPNGNGALEVLLCKDCIPLGVYSKGQVQLR